MCIAYFFFFSSRRRHTRFKCDWSSDVCSSDLVAVTVADAVTMLNPPMTDRQLRDILRALTIPPCGRRWTGGMGRPSDLYDWGEITRLHAAIAPRLDAGSTSPQKVGCGSTPRDRPGK